MTEGADADEAIDTAKLLVNQGVGGVDLGSSGSGGGSISSGGCGLIAGEGGAGVVLC